MNYPEPPLASAPSTAATTKPSQDQGLFDHIGARPRVPEGDRMAASVPLVTGDDQEYRVTHHLYHHYNTSTGGN